MQGRFAAKGQNGGVFILKYSIETCHLHMFLGMLHRARQSCATTEAEYTAQIEAYAQQMQELEAQRAELQSASNKYTSVQNWLETFKEAAITGNLYDPDNAAVMKAMVEYIVVHQDRVEIHLKCGVETEICYIH